MPPVIVWAIGALAAVRLVGAAARRVNADLDRIRSAGSARQIETLERDPRNGVYRPRGNG